MTTDTIRRIDPRGPRFGAAITAGLLALSLALGPAWGLVPLAVALTAFALGAFAGLDQQPWGLIYREWVRPRLAPPVELEDARPPRFAQVVGLGFAVLGMLGSVAGAPVLFYPAVAFALLAATLNALFDFCLGCEAWTIIQRLRRRAVAPRRVAA